MAAMTEVTCHNKHCHKGTKGTRKVFQARTADVKRGWGKFCCKSCKAEEQEGRTGQYKNYLCNKTNGFIRRHQENRVRNDSHHDIHDGHEFHANWSNEDGGDDCGDFDWAYDPDDGYPFPS